MARSTLCSSSSMNIQDLKEALIYRDSIILKEGEFNAIFSGPSQLHEVRDFCNETGTQFEYFKESKPGIFVFRKSLGKKPVESKPALDFRFRRFSHHFGQVESAS